MPNCNLPRVSILANRYRLHRICTRAAWGLNNRMHLTGVFRLICGFDRSAFYTSSFADRPSNAPLLRKPCSSIGYIVPSIEMLSFNLFHLEAKMAALIIPGHNGIFSTPGHGQPVIVEEPEWQSDNASGHVLYREACIPRRVCSVCFAAHGAGTG